MNSSQRRCKNLRINFFIYCGLFVLILVVFVLFLLSLRFGQISPLAFFRWFTATSVRNVESCNRIPSNYCLPVLLSIAPRFWPSKPLAGLGRIWNRYLLTMLTWNRRDSTPLSAAPQKVRNKQKKLILRLRSFISKWFQRCKKSRCTTVRTDSTRKPVLELERKHGKKINVCVYSLSLSLSTLKICCFSFYS